MSFPKLSWGREKHDLADRWPKGPDGTPEKPAKAKPADKPKSDLDDAMADLLADPPKAEDKAADDEEAPEAP